MLEALWSVVMVYSPTVRSTFNLLMSVTCTHYPCYWIGAWDLHIQLLIHYMHTMELRNPTNHTGNWKDSGIKNQNFILCLIYRPTHDWRTRQLHALMNFTIVHRCFVSIVWIYMKKFLIYEYTV